MSVRGWAISGADSTPSGGLGNSKTRRRGRGGCVKLLPVQKQGPGLMGRWRDRFEKAESFVKRDLWLHLPEQRGPRFLYRALRMGVLIVEAFIKCDVFMLSAEPTYQV